MIFAIAGLVLLASLALAVSFWAEARRSEKNHEQDTSGKSHVCLCHQKWFDSQGELEQHLQRQQ